jgi:hypothetical protein
VVLVPIKCPKKRQTDFLERLLNEERDDLSTYQNRVVDRELYWKRQAQQRLKSRAFNSFEGICMILGRGPSCIRKTYTKRDCYLNRVGRYHHRQRSLEKLETGLRDIHAPGIDTKKGLNEEWILL